MHDSVGTRERSQVPAARPDGAEASAPAAPRITASRRPLRAALRRPALTAYQSLTAYQFRVLAGRIPLRLPAADDPAPPMARLAAVSAWAGLLGLVGVGIGVRAGIAMLFDSGLPGWFAPTLIGVGLLGMALTIGAYFAIQARELPWLLLAAASGTLGVVTLLTLTTI